MTNHYHWLVETPQANLVEGMRWFQTTYTRRFNIRHRQWGHVFGGRYKAVIVDPEERSGQYLEALLDYIHLNPARAGMADLASGKGILDYRWSSVSRGYAVASTKRTAWMETSMGLEVKQCADTVAGRRRFVRLLEERVREEREQAGLPVIEEQSLQSTIRRGWYWGGESLREKLLSMKSEEPGRKSGRRHHSVYRRETAEADAERIVVAELKEAGLRRADLERLPGSNPQKVAIAERLHRETTVSQRWIAERLRMGSAGNVSQQLYRRRMAEEGL